MFTPLPPEEYPRAAHLFGAGYPGRAFAQAVLEQRIPGQVWAPPGDERVTSCLVSTSHPFSFLAGTVRPDTVAAALAELRGKDAVILGYPPSSAVATWALPEGFEHGRRVHHSWGGPGRNGGSGELPAGYELARVDAELFDRLNWKAVVLSIFGSAQNYLSHGHGHCVLRGGRVVAEAHNVIGGGIGELGAFTHRDHRQLGLSVIVMEHVARHAAGLGLALATTHDVMTPASGSLSARIGLTRDFEYGVITRANG